MQLLFKTVLLKIFSLLALVIPIEVFSTSYLLLHTSFGDLKAELFSEVAPQTVAQISKLVQAGVYDTTPFFRLERNFVLQTAVVQDRSLPLSSEQRSLIHPIPAEFSQIKHERGILSLARQDHDPNSGETSFSILLDRAPHLDGKYTIFGKLVEGWETLEKIESLPRNARNRPEVRLEICKAEILF